MGTVEKKFKVGACTATVFANEIPTADGLTAVRSVVLQRLYRDKSGVFQNTTSLSVNDVPKAMLALAKAYEFIVMDKEL